MEHATGTVFATFKGVIEWQRAYKWRFQPLRQ
jgi:hypothetical protein